MNWQQAASAAPVLSVGLALGLLVFVMLRLIRAALPPPKRSCPRCGRYVKIGWLACGPCGYTFARQPLRQRPVRAPAMYWPKSPVRLTPPVAPPPAKTPQAPQPAVAQPPVPPLPALKRPPGMPGP